jgi:hypothetical protein
MGIEVIGFVCGDIEDVISAFVKGALINKNFMMPGYGGHHFRRSYRHRGGRLWN